MICFLYNTCTRVTGVFSKRIEYSWLNELSFTDNYRLSAAPLQSHCSEHQIILEFSELYRLS